MSKVKLFAILVGLMFFAQAGLLLAEEETTGEIAAAPEDTGPPFVAEIYEYIDALIGECSCPITLEEYEAVIERLNVLEAKICFLLTDEICDGLDNNCNDLIDETFTDLGYECTVGLGQCQAIGEIVCTEDGLGTECWGQEGEPEEEVCDGYDNDCDGTVDEDCPVVGEPCDDWDDCTFNDVYDSDLVCIGTSYSCDDDTTCVSSVCDGDGGCIDAPNVGVACDDDNVCTEYDSCQSDGTCTGSPFPCPEGQTCIEVMGTPTCIDM